jgi:hypothetical protein
MLYNPGYMQYYLSSVFSSHLMNPVNSQKSIIVLLKQVRDFFWAGPYDGGRVSFAFSADSK